MVTQAGGSRHEYITHTTSHSHLILAHFLSQNREWVAMCLDFGGRRVRMRSVRRHFGHYVSLVCWAETESCGSICLSDARSGRRQYSAGSGSVDDKSQGSRSVIRSVDPVSEHPSMTWHHFIISDRPSNTLLLTERDVTITLLASIQPCAQFMRWI